VTGQAWAETDANDPPGRSIRVAVVDDHPAMREGTAALLAREPDIDVVATGGSAAEARRILAADPPPDVMLLDVRMGAEGGLDVLASEEPGLTAIVLLTAYDYAQYEDAAMGLGAAGFIPKSAPVADLVAAIRLAAAGALVFRRRSRVPKHGFTARERRTVALLAEGRSNDEIAADLGLSSKTIEVTLSRLYRRFGVASRTELATLAVRDGWLDVPELAVDGTRAD
jgi:DNA-binding NarL/FixJ family response regulator